MSNTLTAAMAAAGLALSDTPNIDGKIHRFRSAPDKEPNSWYVLHQFNDITVGAFGCWKRGFTRKFCSKERTQMSGEEWNSVSRAWKESEAARAEEERRNHADVRKKCVALFAAPGVPDKHPYLVKKGVVPCGTLAVSTAENTKGWLALPLQDNRGVIHSAQFIADDGTKKFFYQGRVAGCYHQIARVDHGPVIVCEGYATGASVHLATGWTVFAAMNCGNLPAVARAARELFPNRTIVISADNDQFTEDNPGETKAREAAKAVNGVVAIPSFGDEAMADKPTDFNDLHRLQGLPEVRLQINAAFPVFSRPIGDFIVPPPNDPSELLKHRYLCQKGGLLIPGPTGMGKSSFMLQCYALWSNGLPCFGITPTRPLKCLLIQAENDDGDMAQMRDGIATGLRFTADERRVFFTSVQIHNSTGKTGKAFFSEVVSPLLDLYAPDMLGLDPVLSFLGGDVKEQKVVGEFLRVYLNPLLFSHLCAANLLHHTNKPMGGKDKPNWRNGEMAYLGSGSAEWANWARAILSIQDTGNHGIYQLHAAKRGARLGWKDENDQPDYERLIRHSREKGVICWHDATQDDLPKQEPRSTGQNGRPSGAQAIASMNLHEFLAACPAEGGEGLREIGRRLESFLAAKSIDASRCTCQRVVALMVENRKLVKTADSNYLKGPNA